MDDIMGIIKDYWVHALGVAGLSGGSSYLTKLQIDKNQDKRIDGLSKKVDQTEKDMVNLRTEVRENGIHDKKHHEAFVEFKADIKAELKTLHSKLDSLLDKLWNSKK